MNKKIKVLFFMDGIGNAGGIQEMVIKWLEHMDNDKIQVDILSYNTGKKDNYPERFEKYGGKIYIVQTYVNKKYFIKSFKDLNMFFKEHNDYDILHAHSSSKALFIMLFAKLYGIRTRILHSHCTQFVVQKKIPLIIANLFKPITNLLSTHYFACSPEAGSFLFGKKSIENGKVTIAHNGIDTEVFRYNQDMRNLMRVKLGVENRNVIGHVGRFRPQKNHDYLIDIFYEISKKDENALLLLIGSGELEESIKLKVKNYKIEDKVKFLGFRNDVVDIMQAMDILVMPSLFEGLPVTGVEAQAVGLPCVFADTITKDAKILPISSYLSLNDKPKVWADTIIDIIKLNERHDTLEDVQKKGFDISFETKKLEKFYMEKVNSL